MRLLIVSVLILLLAACSGGRVGAALDACEDTLKERAANRTYSLDHNALKASAQAEGNDLIHIKGTVVFDPGLPRELTLPLECTARFSAGKAEPDIIGFTILWE